VAVTVTGADAALQQTSIRTRVTAIGTPTTGLLGTANAALAAGAGTGLSAADLLVLTDDVDDLTAELAALAAAEAGLGIADGIAAGDLTPSSSTVQNRVRVNFKLTGETDGGLTFGASTRLQINNGGAGGVQGNSVYLSNGTMTLTVGNTSGAIGNTIGIYANGGCGFSATNAYGSYCANVIDQANSAFTGSSSGGTGPNNVRADFALGTATVSVSGGTGLDTEIAVSADLGGVALGVGIDAGAGADGGTYVTLGYNAGSVNLSLAAFNPKEGAQRYIVNATTAVGAGQIGMFVAKDLGGNRWGLNYGASLGGGASANVAIHNQTVAANGVRAGTTIVAGMTFGF
ncbi:MAG: hypothetical protein QNL54_11495, partial [Rhodobacterales bacterium]